MTDAVAPTGPLFLLARRYFDAIEQSDRGALEALLGAGIVQEELPNRLVPKGAVRGREDMLAGFDRGKKVVRGERYRILHALEAGDTIALETEWTATILVPYGSLAAGDTMRARFAVFLVVREGQIVENRNYDCFDPF